VKYIALHIILIFYCVAQDTLYAITIGETSVIAEIEHKVVLNTMSLLNKGKEEPYYLVFDTVPYFYMMFQRLEDYFKKGKQNQAFAMSSISVTEARKVKYSFSSIYMPSKEVVFTVTDHKNVSADSWKKKGTVIGFQVKTTQEKTIQRLKKKYGVIGAPFQAFKHRFNALLQGKINYAIADNVELWNHEKIKILYTLDEQHSEGIAIMYMKHSTLRKKMEKYLRYYLKSPVFYKLIREKYGHDVSNYFKKYL